MLIPPRIIRSVLPENEQGVARHIDHQMYDLVHFTERFKACLLLIDRSKEDCQMLRGRRAALKEHRRSSEFSRLEEDAVDAAIDVLRGNLSIYANWCSIAEKDAVMTIWDFAVTAYAINNLLASCPVFKAMVDRKALSAALAEISTAFPNRKLARHAAGHPADFKKSPAEIRRHATNEKLEGPGLFINGQGTTLHHVSTSDGTVYWTHEGKIIQAKVSIESYNKLNEIVHAIFASFDTAAKQTEQIMLKSKAQ